MIESVLIVASDNDSGGGGGFVVLALIGIVAYFIPTIIAAIRHVSNVGSVVVINLFLGWTFIGWVVALAMAFRSAPAAQHTPPGDYRR